VDGSTLLPASLGAKQVVPGGGRSRQGGGGRPPTRVWRARRASCARDVDAELPVGMREGALPTVRTETDQPAARSPCSRAPRRRSFGRPAAPTALARSQRSQAIRAPTRSSSERRACGHSRPSRWRRRRQPRPQSVARAAAPLSCARRCAAAEDEQRAGAGRELDDRVGPLTARTASSSRGGRVLVRTRPRARQPSRRSARRSLRNTRPPDGRAPSPARRGDRSPARAPRRAGRVRPAPRRAPAPTGRHRLVEPLAELCVQHEAQALLRPAPGSPRQERRDTAGRALRLEHVPARARALGPLERLGSPSAAAPSASPPRGSEPATGPLVTSARSAARRSAYHASSSPTRRDRSRRAEREETGRTCRSLGALRVRLAPPPPPPTPLALVRRPQQLRLQHGARPPRGPSWVWATRLPTGAPWSSDPNMDERPR
jgi:hypothetical protein